jgi:hypothetical protein
MLATIINRLLEKACRCRSVLVEYCYPYFQALSLLFLFAFLMERTTKPSVVVPS